MVRKKQWNKILRAGMALLMLCLTSCLDETLVSSRGEIVPATEKDVFLRVSVPRTYGSGEAAGNKETAINSLDVLVFAPGLVDKSKYYVKFASKGTIVEGSSNRFQVLMPVGDNFVIHVFTNCHTELTEKGFYKSTGMEMEAMLQKLTYGTDPNKSDTIALPMHGFRTGVNISKDDVNKNIQVPLLRSVAAVQVTTNATIDESGDTPVITPGKLADKNGNVFFELKELYAYFQADSARVAPGVDKYEDETELTKGLTRNVKAITLPPYHQVKSKEDKIFIKKTEPVDQTGCLYLFENQPYSENGFDIPGSVVDNPKAATSRLVVGGVYKGDNAANTKVTYYRVDFTEAGKISPILRNHKYTFNITNVTGPGYDNPDDAATGVPINIDVNVMDWKNNINNADFDRENYFYAETKDIRVGRSSNYSKKIKIESDVLLAGNWELSMNSNKNISVKAGVTATQVFLNGTYFRAIAREKELEVYSACDYADNISHSDVLCIKVKNLRVYFNLTQEDRMPSDWVDGGTSNEDIGTPPPHIMVGGVRWALGNLDYSPSKGFFIAPTPDQVSDSDPDPVRKVRGAMFRWFAPYPQNEQSSPSTANPTEQSWTVTTPNWSGITASTLGNYNYYKSYMPTPTFDASAMTVSTLGDPCTALPGGKWRMPTYNEIYLLCYYSTSSTPSGSFDGNKRPHTEHFNMSSEYYTLSNYPKDASKRWHGIYFSQSELPNEHPAAPFSGTGSNASSQYDPGQHLFLPAASFSYGASVGDNDYNKCYYWCSTPYSGHTSYSWRLFASSGSLYPGYGSTSNYRSYGRSVRCVLDN